MDSDTDADADLIAKLESSDLRHILQLFSDHLRPFYDLLSVTAPRKPQKSKKPPTAVRSLAKRFVPFLNRALSVIPKRLSANPKLDEESGLQLFGAYKLCLNCLECVSSQLSCKPYSVDIQRVRLVHCFEAWGRYRDAETEGFSILESLRGIEIGGKGAKTVKKNSRYLPDSGKENVDNDFSFLVVELVVTLVKCVSSYQSKNEGDYRRVLVLVDEVTPWLRALDTSSNEKLHRLLVTYLGKCMLLLVGDLMYFNEDLVREFCSATFDEYLKSSMKDQLEKFACRICSSLFSQQDVQSSSIANTLLWILNYMSSQYKVATESSVMEFLELVCYCANKCRSATRHLCSALAAHLSKVANEYCEVLSPFHLILRLYSAGLSICDFKGQQRQDNSITPLNKSSGSLSGYLLDKEDVLHGLASLLGQLKYQFPTSSNSNKLQLNAKYNCSTNSVCLLHSQIEAHYEACKVCEIKNGKSYLLYYCHALKFLCQPLAELIISARKDITAEDESASFLAKLCNIQDAFNQFHDVFMLFSVIKNESNLFDDYVKAVPSVAVAALTLSFRTRRFCKEGINFVRQIISADWIEVNGLKFLFASLHNVGVTLYRSKQVKEASKALKLCCMASWTCVSHLCKATANSSNRLCSDISEEAVGCFVNEACSKSALLLDILYQCGSQNKVTRIMVFSLESWSAAVNVLNWLPCPITLVKQWVKIKYKISKDPDMECSAATLFSLLSSSAKVSKQSLGIILEQELLAYKEMSGLNPRLCQKMQMDIIAVLLENVYVSDDCCLERSKILIAKGRELRASGIEGLNGCVQCLSDAISTMNGINDENVRQSIKFRHQLAVAYCLHALCLQEAEPCSKKLFEDVHCALTLWSSPDFCIVDDQSDFPCENMLIALYHVVDLLSIKGCVEFHCDIYELLIRLFRRKNVPLEKCLALLWQCKRLGHALCVAPVGEAIVTTMSEHCGKISKLIGFWTSSMRGSLGLALEVGFQQSFSSTCTNFSCGSCHIEGSFLSDIKVDEVKKVASDLTSTVPLSNGSVFLAALLYHDLCVRMIPNGQLIEALSYAKESHRLLSKLLQEKFRYSIEHQNERSDERGDIMHKCCYNLRIFELYNSVATAVWSSHDILNDLECCILTPWNILQCYLESTLQVGTIHEIIGNGYEAEALLLWGKSISNFQGLPIFKVAFSSVLGQLYRKQKQWNAAEDELQSAKQILLDCCTTISCLKCRLLLEVNVDLQLGDLFRSRPDNIFGNSILEGLYDAESLYKSALDKLNVCEWKNSVSNPVEIGAEGTIALDACGMEVGILARNSFVCPTDRIESPSNVDVPENKVLGKKHRNTKKTSKPLLQGQSLINEHNSRMTRSRYLSQRNNVSTVGEVQVGLAKYSNNEENPAFPDALEQRGSLSEIKSSAAGLGCEKTCSCNKMKCFYCLPVDIIQSGCVENFVQMRWEFARRQLSLRLLTGIGKCLAIRGEIHQAHEILLQSMFVLVSRNPFFSYSSIQPAILIDLMGKDIPGDSFALERAMILYNICWVTLKNYPQKGNRINCCDMVHIQISRVVSWLQLAFVLCRDVPILVQKVSRLLAAIFVVSASSDLLSFSFGPCNALSSSHWASYFHQASVGTHLNHQLYSSITGKQKILKATNAEVAGLTGSIPTASEPLNSLRLAPKSLQDLEEHVLRFFLHLPHTTIISLSLLGGALASFLTELLDYPSCTHAWILLSRLNANNQPVVALLPVDSILEDSDDDTNYSHGIPNKDYKLVKHWHCPWGFTVVDGVAPVFRIILEENYISSSTHPSEDTKQNRSSWWMQRKSLDRRLGKFLRDLEDSWFGPWKYLLLGELSDFKNSESVQKKLMHLLKVKCKMDMHESLLKVILEGAKHASIEAEFVLPLILNNGCFIGGSGCCNQKRQGTFSDTGDGIETLYRKALEFIIEAVHEVEEEDCSNRAPVILVLDLEVQMLPWENLPVLRNQEVYRMPSIGSIFATLSRCCHFQEKVGRKSILFPSIDPLDAFYLLNPSGDLSSTQAKFEDWFRDQNLEGKAGTAPQTEELAVALRSHDLFIYFGHGSGAQYIPGHEIEKLENCAATLLMGCSSGSLTLRGSCTPKGAPLCYLLAGSPVIVANLWDVTDKDIDRFGKAMLDSWLRERTTASMGCIQCNSVEEKLKSLHITDTKGNTKKKVSRKKLPKDIKITHNDCCTHRNMIGSFMSQAREACMLPFLIGASPVCYGVPTGISRKKDL
ncbi:separase isoform X3 [Diospyros lotus]|uniref:separase isoform X3 n=1 Tax=Diospyros lotus TaxID=55363 RepID=UPI00224DB844|nr:separase isoform X3 [Diospyros lotus]